MANQSTPSELILDVGGEGRHPDAWNLNPSHVRTIGKLKGQPIPRHIPGRSDDIPLPDGSVKKLIVERTPLLIASLHEIARVIGPTGTIILRHAKSPIGDTHTLARQILPGQISHQIIRLDNQVLRETKFLLSGSSRHPRITQAAQGDGQCN